MIYYKLIDYEMFQDQKVPYASRAYGNYYQTPGKN